MAIVKDVQGILSDYERSYGEIWGEFNEAKDNFDPERMTERVLRDKEQDRVTKLAQLKSTTESAIMKALKKYTDELPRRYTKNPEQVDADTLSMLSGASSGVIELTARDIERLFSQFDGNYTMQAAISEFATKHEIPAHITFYPEDERAREAESYATGAMNALSRDSKTNGLPLSFAYYAEGSKSVPPALVGE